MASFVTVLFEDHSEKKFAITEDTTVAQLIQKVATKLDLRNDIESFGIYEVIGNQGCDCLLVENSATPATNFSDWTRTLFETRRPMCLPTWCEGGLQKALFLLQVP